MSIANGVIHTSDRVDISILIKSPDDAKFIKEKECEYLVELVSDKVLDAFVTQESKTNYYELPDYEIEGVQFRAKYFNDEGFSDYVYSKKFDIINEIPAPKIIIDEKYKNLGKIKQPIKIFFKIEAYKDIAPRLNIWCTNDLVHLNVKVGKNGLYIDLRECWNKISLNEEVTLDITVNYMDFGHSPRISESITFIKDSNFIVNDYTNNDLNYNDLTPFKDDDSDDKKLDDILEVAKHLKSSEFVEDVNYGTPVVSKKYTNPRPFLFLCRGIPEQSLVSRDFNSATNITLNKTMNEVATLTFELPFSKDSYNKLSIDDCNKLVFFEDEYYIIQDIDTDDNEYVKMQVSCIHESSELKDIYCEYIDLIGATPKQMFDKIMDSTMHPVDTGYKWAGTDVDESKKRHLKAESEKSVYENLINMAQVFNGWLEFFTDYVGNKWVFLRTKDIKVDKWLKKGVDLKGLKIKYSSAEMFTRLYPIGAINEKSGKETNIMDVNPTGKSYLENYSYYLNKGIPKEVIDKEAKYQRLKILRADDYINPKDLYEFALEELEKWCYPQLDVSLTMEDLSIFTNSLEIPPEVGYEINCIDKNTGIVLSCRITGVERNYDNPLDTKINISNVIRYDTFFQKIEHSSNTTDKVIKPEDPNNPDNNDNGAYIPSIMVKDGDHVNVEKKFENQRSLITQNSDEIKLTVEELGKAKSEIIVNSNEIKSTVEELDKAKSEIIQNAREISEKVSEDDFSTYKHQTSREISQKVSSGSEFSSEMKQNIDAFRFLFNEASGKMTEITSNGIAIYDGGLLVYDRDRNLIVRIESNGTVVMKNVSVSQLHIGKTDKGSEFYRTLANMESVWFEEVGIGNRLNCRSENFWIDGGRNLEDYVDNRCYKMLQDQGLI